MKRSAKLTAFTALLGLLLCSLMLPANANEQEVDVSQVVASFFENYVGTLPRFDRLNKSLKNAGFVKDGRFWRRGIVSAWTSEESNRYICAFGVIGNHANEVSKYVLEILKEGKMGRHEIKQFQGRVLHLVETQKGVTIIEVIPPYGATTFIFANSMK